MKKFLAILVVLSLVFVAACQQTEPKPKIMCPDGTIVDDAELCPKPQVIETCDDGIMNQDETNIDCGGVCGGYWYDGACHDTPPPIPPTPEVDDAKTEPEGLSDEIVALFEKAEKYNNFKYKYKGPANPNQLYQVSVWKDKVKVVLPATETTTFGITYDAVYLDTTEKTALGYCTWDTRTKCKSEEAAAVDYEKFNFKTPYQWTKEIKAGEVVGSEILLKRNAKRVSFRLDGLNSLMWIDQFYGLPIQIVAGLDELGRETKETITYSYQDLQVNAVFEEDVTPP